MGIPCKIGWHRYESKFELSQCFIEHKIDIYIKTFKITPIDIYNKLLRYKHLIYTDIFNNTNIFMSNNIIDICEDKFYLKICLNCNKIIDTIFPIISCRLRCLIYDDCKYLELLSPCR